MDLREQKNTNRNNFQRHPWERVRLEFVLNTLKECYRNRSFPCRILDIGGGDLYIARAILTHFPASKIVSFDTAYDHCFDLQGIQVINSFDRIPEARYSLILLLDVLEHIENDVEFLRNLTQRFSSFDTYFLITVPLHPFLFSEHDIRLGHKRRYTYKELSSLILDAGLREIHSGNLFSSLLIFRALQCIKNVLCRSSKSSFFNDVAEWNHPAWVTAIVETLLRFDVKYANRFPGLSGYVLASLPV